MNTALVSVVRKLGLLRLLTFVIRRILYRNPDIIREALRSSNESGSESIAITRNEFLEQRQIVDSLVDSVFRGLPRGDWPNTTNIDIINTRHGVLRSTKDLDPAIKFDCNQYFQYREKAEVALTACSMWRGGDYMEFGSTDLNTFRNMLTATDIYSIMEPYPDTRFFAFDVFGKVDAESEPVREALSGDEY